MHEQPYHQQKGLRYFFNIGMINILDRKNVSFTPGLPILDQNTIIQILNDSGISQDHPEYKKFIKQAMNGWSILEVEKYISSITPLFVGKADFSTITSQTKRARGFIKQESVLLLSPFCQFPEWSLPEIKGLPIFVLGTYDPGMSYWQHLRMEISQSFLRAIIMCTKILHINRKTR